MWINYTLGLIDEEKLEITEEITIRKLRLPKNKSIEESIRYLENWYRKNNSKYTIFNYCITPKPINQAKEHIIGDDL